MIISVIFTPDTQGRHGRFSHLPALYLPFSSANREARLLGRCAKAFFSLIILTKKTLTEEKRRQLTICA